ncbi:MAG: hypothetical protein K8S25_07610 [Alphaproteobacteria bacterium]|nr:hypothetical protein [Alphaproteobacteria bacterium]
MYVDLFVGTLTRYYSEQWQNAATRQGVRSPFGPQQSKSAVTDPVELQGIIAGWLEEASLKLKEHLKEPLSWQEGMLAPYQVGELGLSGYGGLVLLTAYTNNAHLPRPVMAMKSWDGDPAIEAAMKAEKKDALWEIVNCGIWFPVDFPFGIGMKDPSGSPLKAGSIELLWRGLEYLNEVNWGAAPEEIARWRTQAPTETDSFDTQAQFGFATFYELCRFAREQRLPMKLHY